MNTAPTTYAIRVEGHLDDHWSAWLGGLDMTRDDDGATTVTVQVADQAQLHGVLAGLRDIGAVISELRTTDAPVADRAGRCSSARCTPSASPSVPPPPTTPTRPGGSAGSSPSTSGSPAAPPTSTATASCSRSRPVSRPPSSSPSATTPRPRSSATSCSAARTPGPSSLSPTRPATRRQSSAGSSIPPTPATATPPKPCVSSSATASRTSACAGSPRTASSTTTPSWRLMERVGMRRELHAVRESLHRSGRWLDTVGYAILDEEWSPT